MGFLKKVIILLAILAALISPISANGGMSNSGPTSGGCYADPKTGEITCVDSSGSPTSESPSGPTDDEFGGTIVISTSRGSSGGYLRPSDTPISTILPTSSPMSTIPSSTQITQDPNYQQLISQQNRLKEISNELDTMAQRERESDKRAYIYALKETLKSVIGLYVRFMEFIIGPVY